MFLRVLAGLLKMGIRPVQGSFQWTGVSRAKTGSKLEALELTRLRVRRV